MVVIDKFESVRVLINEHNEAVGGPKSVGFIEVEVFLNKIKMAGGTSDDRLKGFSHEEILTFLPDFDGVKPLAIAKDIAKIFRGKEEAPSKYVSAKKVDKMSFEELIKNFDPEDFNSPTAERLKKVVKNEAFIVYSNGRIVDVEKTLELFNEIKKGFKGRKTFLVNGVPTKVYRIGELPDDLVDENPLYPGRPLRPDGTCDQLNRSWQGVSKEIKQFVRIALELGHINVTSDGGLDRAHAILDVCLNENALNLLRNRYHQVSVEFDHRKKIGTLPPLFVVLTDINATNPFEGGKQVVWVSPRNTNEQTTKSIARSMGYYDPHAHANNFLAVNKDNWQAWKK